MIQTFLLYSLMMKKEQKRKGMDGTGLGYLVSHFLINGGYRAIQGFAITVLKDSNPL